MTSSQRRISITTGLALCLLPAASSCSRRPRFEIVGLSLSHSDSEYSTSFSYGGEVVVTGDVGRDRLYFVVLRVKRTSGGDPATYASERNPFYTATFVENGRGDVNLPGAYRSKGETWPAPKYELI